MKIKYSFPWYQYKKHMWYLIDWATLLQIDIERKNKWFGKFTAYIEGDERLVDDFILKNKIKNYTVC
jgi:hypothetical protein